MIEKKKTFCHLYIQAFWRGAVQTQDIQEYTQRA